MQSFRRGVIFTCMIKILYYIVNCGDIVLYNEGPILNIFTVFVTRKNRENFQLKQFPVNFPRSNVAWSKNEIYFIL